MRISPTDFKVARAWIDLWNYKAFYKCKVSNGKLEKVFKGKFLLHTRAGNKVSVCTSAHVTAA